MCTRSVSLPLSRDPLNHLIPAGTALREMLDALPSLILVADWKARVVEANRAAREWTGFTVEPDLAPGDFLHCSFAEEPGVCGATEACVTCLIRGSLEAVRPGGPPASRMAHAVLVREGRAGDYWFRVTAAPIVIEGQELVLLALEDMTQVIELREVLPVCPGCQAPRDPAEVLHEARHFLKRHPGVLSSRELCPRCLRDTMPAPYDEDVL